MITLELSRHNVEIHDTITWGQQEAMRAPLMGAMKVTQSEMARIKSGKGLDVGVDFDGARLLEAKYVAIEVMVHKITDSEGKEVIFSRDWLNNLTPEDGDKLYNAVNAVTNPQENVGK